MSTATPPPGPDGMRIGTTERDAALTALGNHMRAGRLTPDEYSARAQQVTTARTDVELRAIFSDLPGHGGFGQAAMEPRAAVPPAPPEPSLSRDRGPDRTARPDAGLHRFTPVAGTLGFVLMMVCGFAFDGWAWSWLFLMLPALTSTLGRPDRG
ncbi:MAG: DUF1707 domain-containing protein [Nakamurella sp.]